MSDFAAVAESDRFPAKWAAGDAKENELVLSADFGEGTFLSGSVWESAEGDEKPWHCIFRFSQEDMGIDDQGFDTHEEAVLAVEGYFGSAGYDVDKMSRADALLALEAEHADGKISTKDALALARIAMRTDQGLYNARTGTVLMPSVDVERGRVMGIYRAEVKLSEIVDPKSCEVIRNAWKHASFYEPDRWHDGEIGFCPTRNEHSAIDYIVRAMEKDGCGWCFADECSISAKCGLVPDRYVSVQYAPDNLDEIDEGKDALGWGDFLDAAEGNASYAMRLVDRCEWQSPFTLADEDERNGEAVRFGGQLFCSNGHSLDDFDVASADGQIGLSDRTDELRDAAQRQASVRGFSPFAVREGGER